MNRLLFNLRLRHGGQWKRALPSLDEILEAMETVIYVLVAVGVLLAIYHVVDLNDRIGDERARHMQTSQMLGDCLQNKAYFQVDGQIARCVVTWMKD